MIPILIMGLPGSGKTTLAVELQKQLNAVLWNADDVRQHINKDLGFTNTDRIEQAKRMGWLANNVTKMNIPCIADFVCPLEECRTEFGKAFLIFVDRIESSRFPDTNAIFQPPTNFDVKIPYGMTIMEQVNLIMNKYHFNRI